MTFFLVFSVSNCQINEASYLHWVPSSAVYAKITEAFAFRTE
ncbi:hypothetical protein NIES2104_07500 [Leptolyngbya sp. NIES-2104]|nr:hypothetical protein NIES2104_07500 [Leptolyngbya sp. NIES-2104]